MIPLLPKNVEFLVIDDPGHGLSSPFTEGISYIELSGLWVLRKLQKDFGWKKMSFLGHSLGAMKAFAYASTFPEDVDYLVCIDNYKPNFDPDLHLKRGKLVDKLIKYDEIKKQPHKMYTMDELIQKWHDGSGKTVDLDKCIYLLKRCTAPSNEDSNKFYITTDPRVKTMPIFNYSHEQVVSGTWRMTMPILIIKVLTFPYIGKPEYHYEVLDILRKVSRDCQYNEIGEPYKHHVHLNNPEVVKDWIGDFINTHHVFDDIVR